MHLDQTVGSPKYKAYPGVYSTSFAIQLLSTSPDIATRNRELILSGFEYLIQQFEDACLVENGSLTTGKQSQKYTEVGHHDFVLTLKLCAVLQAANSIASIIQVHAAFGDLLAKHDDRVNQIAERLKAFAIEQKDGSTLLRAWPWHVLNGNAREADPVPTAEVLLTLTHPALKGSRRWLNEHAEVAAYLCSVVCSESLTLLDRSIAAHALLELAARTGQEYLSSGTKDQLTRVIKASLRDLSNVPWQEVMHYPVPSKARTVSHYKPWIWLFPRIEYVECLCLLDVSTAGIPAAQVVADLMSNISKNSGKVIFLHAEPPTLLANLRASQLLLRFQRTILPSLYGRSLFVYAQLSKASRSTYRFGWLGFSLVLLAMIRTYALPFASQIQQSSRVHESVRILEATGRRLYSVWPIWLIVFGYLLVTADGNLSKRVKKALGEMVLLVVIGLLVHLLATWT
jgi:hypothetical protein